MPDLEPVQKRIVAVGAVEIMPRTYERNVRYENASTSLTGRGIVLRLREDQKVRLTYKEPLAEVTSTGDILQRFEAEVVVDDFATMETILEKLGFRPYMIYEKYRTTYQLQDTDVMLDEMPYGNFVEIEGQLDSIERVLELLDLSEAVPMHLNYASLFENAKKNLGLSFNDLTFDNFGDIEVSLVHFSQSMGDRSVDG